MSLHSIIHTGTNLLRQNAPALLSSTAITGVVTTAYLSGKAAVEAENVLKAHDFYNPPYRYAKDRVKARAKLVWKLYVPTALSGAVTIGCIVGTTRISGKRAAAAQAAFVITERAYSEYRNKVIEEYGEGKEQKIRDSIAEDRLKKNPPPSDGLMLVGPGKVLCCEMHTGRYFSSDMETLRKAQNDLNARLLGHDSCSLDDWYWLIGLAGTANSGDLGWNADKLMELEFTSVLTDDGRPCLAFNYNYIKPIYDSLCKW
jgi:hypothetical protein